MKRLSDSLGSDSLGFGEKVPLVLTLHRVPYAGYEGEEYGPV
jgi:hypothetical protein